MSLLGVYRRSRFGAVSVPLMLASWVAVPGVARSEPVQPAEKRVASSPPPTGYTQPYRSPVRAAPEPIGRGLSLGIAAGMYVGLNVLAYLAWWRSPPDHFEWKHEGWFGSQTYAGGADKLGHVFMNHLLTRANAGILQEGGWGPRTSTFAGASLTLGTYLVFEMRDGYKSGFSETDIICNFVGAGLGVLMREVPVLDELFDTRVEWVPSRGYFTNFKQEGFNFNEDYTGLTFLLAWHLSTLSWVEAEGGPLRFADLVLGFNARYYRPKPVDPATIRTQESFFGISLNLQRVVDELWLGERHPRPSSSTNRTYRLTRFATEFFNLPYTSLHLLSWENTSRKASSSYSPRD